MSSSSSSSLPRLLLSPKSSEEDSVITETQKVRQEERVEAELPVLQKVKKNYARELDYGTYRLTKSSPNCNETVSSYITKPVKTVRSQVKAHIFDKKDSISIMDLMALFMLSCNKIVFLKEQPYRYYLTTKTKRWPTRSIFACAPKMNPLRSPHLSVPMTPGHKNFFVHILK